MTITISIVKKIVCTVQKQGSLIKAIDSLFYQGRSKVHHLKKSGEYVQARFRCIHDWEMEELTFLGR